MRYFTADLHLGDKPIISWRGFGDDVAAHDAMILSRLNERVGEDDELWLLGDLCRAHRGRHGHARVHRLSYRACGGGQP